MFYKLFRVTNDFRFILLLQVSLLMISVLFSIDIEIIILIETVIMFYLYKMKKGGFKISGIADIDIDIDDALNNMTEGFAYHEIIMDHDRNPIDYKYLYVNKAFSELTGLGQEIIGSTLKEVIPGAEDVWIHEYGEVAINGGSIKFQHYSKPLEKLYDVCAYQVRQNKFAVIFSDMTEIATDKQRLKNAMTFVKKSSDSKLQFLKDINHRLRTPLNGMMGMAQLIDTSNLGEEDLEFYAAMQLEMSHSKNIINQISKYLEIKNVETIATENNVFDQVREIINTFSECGRVKVIYDDEMVLTCNYSFELFNDVIEELLKNALKYSSKPVCVSIYNKLKNHKTTMCVEVRDEGVGIDEDKIDLVFNELYHHDFIHIYKPENNFTLAMCKQLANDIKGDLRVESIKGIGSTFFFSFPAIY